jgi:hypothetical protein
MIYKNEIESILRRIVRVSATFFVLSISACSAALVFGVSSHELGVAVAVPILWLFAISRVFVLALPRTTPQERPAQQTELFVAVAAWFLSGIGAMDFFFSALTFSWLGVSDLAIKSYEIAAFSGEACAAIMLFVILLVMRAVFDDLASAMIFVVRNILRWPAELADGLSLPHVH